MKTLIYIIIIVGLFSFIAIAYIQRESTKISPELAELLNYYADNDLYADYSPIRFYNNATGTPIFLIDKESTTP